MHLICLEHLGPQIYGLVDHRGHHLGIRARMRGLDLELREAALHGINARARACARTHGLLSPLSSLVPCRFVVVISKYV